MDLMDNAKPWIGLMGVSAILGLIVLPIFGVVDPIILGGLGLLGTNSLSLLGGMAIPSVPGLTTQQEEEEPKAPYPPPGANR